MDKVELINLYAGLVARINEISQTRLLVDYPVVIQSDGRVDVKWLNTCGASQRTGNIGLL